MLTLIYKKFKNFEWYVYFLHISYFSTKYTFVNPTPLKKTYSFDWPSLLNFKKSKLLFLIVCTRDCNFFLYFFVILFADFFIIYRYISIPKYEHTKKIWSAHLRKCVRTQFENPPSPLVHFLYTFGNPPPPCRVYIVSWPWFWAELYGICGLKAIILSCKTFAE